MAGGHGGDREIEFSAVITCYREEQTIREFHRRLSTTLREIGRPFEIVYVNDGSVDRTLPLLLEIFAEDPCVGAVLDLCRNSGSPAAVAAGCTAARGRNFIFLDSDLQLEPEDLPRLVREFDRPVDLVNGVRRSRRDSWQRAAASKAFNLALRWVSGVRLLDMFCTFKVARGELVRGLAPGPANVMNPVHLAAAARDWADVPVAHHARPHGSSNWRLAGLLALAVDTVLGSVRYPFQIVGLLGFVFAAVALFGAGLFTLVGSPASLGGWGWMLVLFALALNLLALFLIGEYLVRLHRAALGPPRYIVRALWRREAPEGDHRP